MGKIERAVSILIVLTLAAGIWLAGCAKPAPAPKSQAPAAAPAATTAPAPKPAAAALPKALIFGSQPIGTSTYVVCTGLASVMQKYTGIKVIVQPMATTALMYNELDAGRMHVAAMSQASSYPCFRGEEEYKEMGPKSIRQLGTGNATGYVWVTRPDTGIKSIRDLAGKKVSYLTTISPSRNEIFKLSLEYNGVLDKVVGLKRISMESGAQDLIEKKVDAIGGPLGTFAYGLQQASGIVIISMGGEEVSKYIVQKRPDLVSGAVVGTYPPGYYTLTAKMDTLSSFKEIDVSPRMSDDVAYAITKAIYDHPEDTKAIHRDVGEFNLEQALKPGIVVPTHPGGIRYYKEKGMWTKELEEEQQKLLALEKGLAAKKK